MTYISLKKLLFIGIYHTHTHTHTHTQIIIALNNNISHAYFNRNCFLLLTRRLSLTYNRPYDTRPICQANSNIQQKIYCLWSYALLLTLYRRARNQKFVDTIRSSRRTRNEIFICSKFLSSSVYSFNQHSSRYNFILSVLNEDQYEGQYQCLVYIPNVYIVTE